MAASTPQMGLYTWNKPLDPYDYVQLTLNWNKVDYHDHTPGRGTQIPAGGIAPGAIGPLELNFVTSQIGAWVSLVSDLASSVIAAAGYYTPSARLEGDNDMVRLKGALTNNTGASIAADTTLMTLPSEFCPSTSVMLNGNVNGSAAVVNITSGGVVSLSVALNAISTGFNGYVLLDGLTYTLS